VGTINVSAKFTRLAHHVGASLASTPSTTPRATIDVRAPTAISCLSAYKFSAPHGYSLRQARTPAAPTPTKPSRLPTIPRSAGIGTLNHEAIAVITECVNYLADSAAWPTSVTSAAKPSSPLCARFKIYERSSPSTHRRPVGIPGLGFYGSPTPPASPPLPYGSRPHRYHTPAQLGQPAQRPRHL